MATEQEVKKNQEIVELIKKSGYNRFAFDKNKFMLISEYTGISKLEGFNDKGYSFNFDVNDAVVRFMWRLAYKFGFKSISSNVILDPSCGIGRFLRYAPSNCKVVGYEVDNIAHNIASLLYPKFDIVQNTFESSFYFTLADKKIDFKTIIDKYDLVIGKPPYFYPYENNYNIYSKYELEKYPFCKSLEEVYLMRVVESLNTNGLAVLLIPSWIMDNTTNDSPLKLELMQKVNMLDAYRLPNNAFSDVEITTDIIVLKKK